MAKKKQPTRDGSYEIVISLHHGGEQGTRKGLLMESRLDHVDETGVRIKGLLHWVHVNATPWLTLYSWHRKRGQEAMDEIGILPSYTGRAIYNRLSSYDNYSCQHSVCGAHLLRDCLWVAEREKQPWATAMNELLRGMAKAAVFEGSPFPIAWEPRA